MDSLAIVGTVATLVFGALGTYLAIRRVYPGRLLFVQEDCIGLFDSIVRNLPELAVQFNGVPVKENLVLLKGFFLNTGHKDISIAMVDQRLRANLPEGYRWLTAKVVSASPDVKASAQVASETALEFDLGLFRCGEFLKFEALAEVPTFTEGGPAPSESLDGDLAFDHRIADTGRIKAAYISEATPTLKRLLPMAIIALLVGIFPGFLLSPWLNNQSKVDPSELFRKKLHVPRDRISFVIHGGGRSMEVWLRPQSSGAMEVTEIDGDYHAVLSVQELNSMKPEIKVLPDEPGFRSELFGLRLITWGFAIFVLLLVNWILIDAFRKDRLRKLLPTSGGDRPSNSGRKRKGGV